jgi:hypothetical protein
LGLTFDHSNGAAFSLGFSGVAVYLEMAAQKYRSRLLIHSHTGNHMPRGLRGFRSTILFFPLLGSLFSRFLRSASAMLETPHADPALDPNLQPSG